MTAVIFETPGLIDVRAFTIMGAHAKPNSTNPIGYFGTGLKYAIAGLVRMGCEPVVWIGRDRLSFTKRTGKFRGTDLETVRMSVLKDGNKRATHYELPFTTRYGANWKPWMLFRELESNTRDEGGKTYLFEPSTDYGREVKGIDGITRISVDHPEFVEAANNIDSIFLPRARREGKLLDALPADAEDGCPFIYYRTMRAKDLGKPSMFTYNIVEYMTLTEDRQLAYEFQIREVLAKWVLTEATESQIEKIMTADEEWWEHGLEFPLHVQPSSSFRAVMARKPKGLSRYAHSYYSGWTGGYLSRPEKSAFRLFDEFKKPWALSGDYVFDKDGDAVFERPDDMGGTIWEDMAEDLIKRLDAGLPKVAESVDEEVEEVTPAEPL